MFIYYGNRHKHTDQESNINDLAQDCGVSNTWGMKTLLAWYQAIVTEIIH